MIKTALWVVVIILMTLFFIGASSFKDSDLASETVLVKAGRGHGSGVHIGQGYVLTAAHVVDNLPKGQAVLVKTTKDTPHVTEVLWEAKRHDIALLRIKNWQGIKSASINCRAPEVGDPVYVEGSPLVLRFVRMSGYVASIYPQRRSHWAKTIVLDVTGQGGMSGGPVFNQSREIVGIFVGMIAFQSMFAPPISQQFTFAVPSTVVCNLLRKGKV